jgi:hypothetical protein
MKICKKCNIEKSLDDFHNLKSSKDGKQPKCKICHSEIQKNYLINNRDKINERKKKYRESENGKLVSKGYRKKYYLENKKIENKRSNEWNKLNREKMKDYNNEYSKEYRKNNPEIHAWRGLLHNYLRRVGKTKEGHTIDLLGYSILELKEHITSLFTEEMSWDNYGQWHIDHIKPVVTFDKDADIKIVNALSNLRPLWATTREINGIIYEGNLNRVKYEKY